MHNINQKKFDIAMLGLISSNINLELIRKVVNDSEEIICDCINQNWEETYNSDTREVKTIEQFWIEVNTKYKNLEKWDFFWELGIDSDRATYFIWAMLRSVTVNRDVQIINVWDYFGLDVEPRNRVKNIRKFLILFERFGRSLNLIAKLREAWAYVLNQKLKLNFLNDINLYLLEWVLNKIQEFETGAFLNHGKVGINLGLNKEFGFNRDKYDFAPKIKVDNVYPEESKLYIQHFFDSRFHYDEYNKRPLSTLSNDLFHLNLNKQLKDKISRMYSQKIYQLNKQDLEPFNTYLEEKYLKNFKKLQKKHGLNKSDMLVYLINYAINNSKVM